MTEHSNGQRHDRTALLLYGSETGNSQDVAGELARIAERLHFVARVSEMDAVEISHILNYSVVIFAVGTTGQGEFPRNARRFWKSLLRKRLPPTCLNHVSFTTFGLGDSSYPKFVMMLCSSYPEADRAILLICVVLARFNWAARKLHKRLEQLGAKEIYPRGEADEQHEEGIDGTFLSWSLDLRRHLLSLFPLPDGVNPISKDVLLLPKFTLKLLEKTSQQDLQETPSLNSQDTSIQQSHPQIDNESLRNSQLHNSTMLYIPPPDANEPAICPQVRAPLDAEVESVDSESTSSRWIPIPDSFRVWFVENKRVTPESHWQDVRLLTLQMEADGGYEPGDTITIFPKNFPEDVEKFIDLMDWHHVADEPLKFEAVAPNFLIDPLFVPLPAGLYPLKNSTLRQLLTHNLDFTAIPKPYFFHYISFYTENETHKERLREFADSAYRDEYYDYATRPRRSILEVLADFDSVKLPFTDVASIIPVIRGRQFSICSGGLGAQVGHDIHHSSKDPPPLIKVQLLVAIVKYQTVLKKVRQGLCSRYIASLEPNTLLNVKMTTSETFYKLSYEQPYRPVVMVAAGTGIAPCRSLIWERAKLVTMRDVCNVDYPVGPNTLIYGGRNKKADFFFSEEWASAALRTDVMTAFSRDQKEKIYVQDVIRREGERMVQAIKEGAVIYVCGSSGNMPKAVREAFIWALMKFGGEHGTIREDAEKVIGDMEKKGAYVQETW